MSDNVWYPFTQAKGAPAPLQVIHGKGAEVTLSNGKVLIDAISSWWVNIHGHAHPLISKAILDQALKIEHIIFAGFTHEPAMTLADNLISLLPKPLSKVFFSDNGSTAVEVALKMAVQYFSNKGNPRYKIIAFEGGYHGDTFGAMAAGSRSAFSAPFESMLFDVTHFPFPETWIGDATVESREDVIIQNIQEYITENSGTVAALIIEPLIQGAGGMRMCRPAFLQKLKEVCTANDVLLIFDEVMTGFGRTGDFFATTKADVVPDLLCLSKGITGGFLPLSVTIATQQIYDAFCSDKVTHTFYHGHSYTANPLGCAAANASIEIMNREQKFRKIEVLQTKYEQIFLDHPQVEKVRRCGTILAFDIKVDDQKGYFNPIGAQLKQKFPELGVLLRPLGNVLYVMPPYCISEVQLQKIYDVILSVLDEMFPLEPKTES